MSSASYARGFCKVAEAAGVNPVVLAEYVNDAQNTNRVPVEVQEAIKYMKKHPIRTGFSFGAMSPIASSAASGAASGQSSGRSGATSGASSGASSGVIVAPFTGSSGASKGSSGGVVSPEEFKRVVEEAKRQQALLGK